MTFTIQLQTGTQNSYGPNGCIVFGRINFILNDMHNKKSLKVLPSILKSVRYDEEVYVYDTPSLTPLKKPLKGERLCGYCGSTATTYVGDESYGSNAGGRDHEEFHCQQCKKYTVYLRDWG